MKERPRRTIDLSAWLKLEYDSGPGSLAVFLTAPGTRHRLLVYSGFADAASEMLGRTSVFLSEFLTFAGDDLEPELRRHLRPQESGAGVILVTPRAGGKVYATSGSSEDRSGSHQVARDILARLWAEVRLPPEKGAGP